MTDAEINRELDSHERVWLLLKIGVALVNAAVIVAWRLG